MRLISQLLMTAAIIFNSCGGGQDKEFAKIQYASFDVNSHITPQKDTPFISLYAEIESNGLIHINDDDKYFNQHNYVIVKLSTTQLDSLKAIFNSDHKLNQHLKEYQFRSGEEFLQVAMTSFMLLHIKMVFRIQFVQLDRSWIAH